MGALILALLGLAVGSANSSLTACEKKYNYRKSTITNVALQDELYVANFKEIMNALEAMNKVTPLVGSRLLDALEFLYKLYDLPDRRDLTKKVNDRKDYLEAIRSKKIFYDDFSQANLTQRIWYDYYPSEVPHVKNPQLLLSIPDVQKKVNGITYYYDYRGIPTNMYCTVPAKIIDDIKLLLTRRDLAKKGFHYSGTRQESDWQQIEKRLAKRDEEEKKYPWLYN